jgi:hypothetical protein
LNQIRYVLAVSSKFPQRASATVDAVDYAVSVVVFATACFFDGVLEFRGNVTEYRDVIEVVFNAVVGAVVSYGNRAVRVVIVVSDFSHCEIVKLAPVRNR